MLWIPDRLREVAYAECCDIRLLRLHGGEALDVFKYIQDSKEAQVTVSLLQLWLWTAELKVKVETSPGSYWKSCSQNAASAANLFWLTTCGANWAAPLQ